MPTIHRIGPFAIRVFSNDHGPVHVHAYSADFIARVFLDGRVEVIAGKAPPNFGAVGAWVMANGAVITAAWERTRPG